MLMTALLFASILAVAFTLWRSARNDIRRAVCDSQEPVLLTLHGMEPGSPCRDPLVERMWAHVKAERQVSREVPLQGMAASKDSCRRGRMVRPDIIFNACENPQQSVRGEWADAA